MRPRVQIEIGPLTVAIGASLRIEASLRPLALALGPVAVMWTPTLPGWGVYLYGPRR